MYLELLSSDRSLPGHHVSCHALWNHDVPRYVNTILQVLHLVQPSSRHMHHLAMVLVDRLNICTPGIRVFAQESAEFGNISLAEEGVKHVTSILGAFVKALLTLMEFLCYILVGRDDAAKSHLERAVPSLTCKKQFV